MKGHIPFICLPVISKISNTRLNTKYKSARFLFPWAVNKQLFFGGGERDFAPVYYSISVFEEPATLALGIEE